ncbi:hypothetical protein HY570_02750, partial [Candidatus Micrarchaeota archaeon]|nr:hypothetical protein [Candidatus Micrarchaeota archaeon]
DIDRTGKNYEGRMFYNFTRFLMTKGKVVGTEEEIRDFARMELDRFFWSLSGRTYEDLVKADGIIEKYLQRIGLDSSR